MIYTLYQFFSFLFYPFVQILLLFRVKKAKEDQLRYQEKLGIYKILRPEGKLVWFHAASIGEFNAILPIIKEIEHNVLLTTVTLTSAQLAQTNLPSTAIHQFAPVDCINVIKKFFQHWQPDLVVWTESELWPNMIMMCNKPMLLINARISEKSYLRWKRTPFFVKQILGKFALILAQNFETKAFLADLGLPSLCVGNLKYLATNFSFNEEELKILKKQTAGRIILMAASTHPGEEEMFLRINQSLRCIYPNLLIIIAPRHIERKESLLALFTGTKLVTRSSRESINVDTQIFLVDTLGEFGLFFPLSDIVCVGGSWTKIAHSFIEAAKYGNLILFGDKLSNSKEVADEFLKADAALFAKDAEQIEKIVTYYLNAPKDFVDIKNNAKEKVRQMSNIKNKVLEKIHPFLDKL